MKAWSNIQISPRDPEIIKINTLEKGLGELPGNVKRIRELITRFEVCHFKYQQHIRKIKNSIINLDPDVDPAKIGINHIHSGEGAWKNDTTGRSFIGQQYVWAIREWLNDGLWNENSGHYNKESGRQIRKWLGDKNPDKVRLVRLLLARLTWDWKSYEQLMQGEKFKDIEFQACRIDICHYTFPKNLDLLLQGIGQMKPVNEEGFEGCGSSNDKIKDNLSKEFLKLNDMLRSFTITGKTDKNELIKAWLVACLAKTIKEAINLELPVWI